jgi:DNA-binding XRE family transcriptional regulator
MFHRAISLKTKEGTMIELTFQDGKVIRYDMSVLFDKYPQLRALEDRKLFESGRLMGYGIIWNDDLDIETETIYEEGKVVRTVKPATYIVVGKAVATARATKGLSQKELSEISGIDQSDISKIERGVANPSVGTLTRIAEALGSELKVSII